MSFSEPIRRLNLLGIIVLTMTTTSALAHSRQKVDSQQLRADYIARLQQQAGIAQPQTSLGSLYSSNAAYADMAADYKARRVDDVVTLVVIEKTSALTTGDANTSRTTQTNAAITALPGKLKTGGVNPLWGSNSANTLKAQGETSKDSNFSTTLAARVIALLGNGNLVVEAERKIQINSQHDTMIVRGVLRPGDIGPNNTALSTSLANLEMELKGKGIVSDPLVRPNPIIRGFLWLLGF